jgi:hypothetical protein
MYTEELHNKCSSMQVRIRELQTEIASVNARIAGCKTGTPEHTFLTGTFWEHSFVQIKIKTDLTMLTVQPIRM